MRPKQLAVVGTVCLLSGILGVALRVGVPEVAEPYVWYPLWTAMVYLSTIVGAGLLMIGLSFRPVGPAPRPRRPARALRSQPGRGAG
ncbi:MAG: hypothetical protein DCC50_02925 [Acidobacteria bacterium]|nr:MAG: hypothetical protein DCC50_02925 [Acidobacteriota bacterium]